MTKRYKLLKDYLGFNGNIPAGEILVNQKVGDSSYYIFVGEYKSAGLIAQVVENNPDWFQEIKESVRIEVREFWYECKSTREGSEYCFEINVVIPKEKVPSVKKAIENVLNDEGNTTIGDMRKHFNLPMYTQEQLNEAIRDAFNSGRHGPRNKSWKDYLSSLKK